MVESGFCNRIKLEVIINCLLPSGGLRQELCAPGLLLYEEKRGSVCPSLLILLCKFIEDVRPFFAYLIFMPERLAEFRVVEREQFLREPAAWPGSISACDL